MVIGSSNLSFYPENSQTSLICVTHFLASCFAKSFHTSYLSRIIHYIIVLYWESPLCDSEGMKPNNTKKYSHVLMIRYPPLIICINISSQSGGTWLRAHKIPDTVINWALEGQNWSETNNHEDMKCLHISTILVIHRYSKAQKGRLTSAKAVLTGDKNMDENTSKKDLKKILVSWRLINHYHPALKWI